MASHMSDDRSAYKKWYQFGYDHEKEDRATLKAFLEHVGEIYDANALKPDALFCVERYCTRASGGIPKDYLNSGFSPTSTTCPKLRQILAYNDIRYGRNTNKAGLVETFNDMIEIMRQKNGISTVSPQAANLSDLLGNCSISRGASHSCSSSSSSSGNSHQHQYQAHFQHPASCSCNHHKAQSALAPPSTNATCSNAHQQTSSHFHNQHAPAPPRRECHAQSSREQPPSFGQPSVHQPRPSMAPPECQTSLYGNANQPFGFTAENAAPPAVTSTTATAHVDATSANHLLVGLAPTQRMIAKWIGDVYVNVVYAIRDDNIQTAVNLLREAANKMDENIV